MTEASRVLRAAMTETRNAFDAMPERVEELDRLAGRLDELREANLAHHRGLIARAAAEGVQILGLGELFSAPYFALERREMWRALAEDAVDGPTVRAMREAAREHAMILVAPIYELDAASQKRFNTAVLVDERGEILGKYRKSHIPKGANERGDFDETFYYEASDGELGDWPANRSANPHFPVFETRVGRIAVAICYDRHFAGVIEAFAREGAELVFSPAVTFGAKSRRMWELEFDVDACRNRVFLGGSNRRGAEAPWDVEYFGASRFVGPEGRVETRPSPAGLVIADLDLAELSGDDRAGWNFARDARPEIY